MLSPKAVSAHARVQRRSPSAGLSVAQLHGEHLPGRLDPFLAIDHFRMAEPFFPPHPHAGFSAVTYMLPRSEGGFVNRDSRGERVEIRPGDLHWTAAGRGIMHEEVSRRGRPRRGGQATTSARYSFDAWIRGGRPAGAFAGARRSTAAGAAGAVVAIRRRRRDPSPWPWPSPKSLRNHGETEYTF